MATVALALAACGPTKFEARERYAAQEAALAAGAQAAAARQAAAAVPAGPPPGMRPTPMALTSLACEDGQARTLRTFPEQGIAILLPDGEGQELQWERGAAGLRYAGPDLVVTAQGTRYTIARAGAAPIGCTATG